MKSTTTGIASGCVIWGIVFAVISGCLLPTAMAVGGVSSSTSLAVRTVGPMVCPKATTPTMHTYQTTSIDDNGFETPATGYEIQCLDANGDVAHTDSVSFAFIWIGILAAFGMLIAALLAFLLAAPAGVWVAKMFPRKQAT